jgi:phosphatidylserine decarboxylase
MKLHREGYLIITIGLLILIGIQFFNFYLWSILGFWWLFALLTIGVLVMAYLIIQFFRIPKIIFQGEENEIYSPADGKVVVIEEVIETEYFKDKRIQISIFMSPLNVHANFNPISGIVKYVKYHSGKFLVAWHPKSSTDNERTTFVVEHSSKKEIMHRQIAGAVARRICYYIEPNDYVKAGEEYGFIKFGSRIDLLLPLDTKIEVKIGDTVKGRKTKIGEIN